MLESLLFFIPLWCFTVNLAWVYTIQQFVQRIRFLRDSLLF